VLFEDFYKKTFKNTFRFFYYRGASFSDIDDLSSECYIRFYQKYQEKLQDEAESQKILSGIAANILKEWQRKTYAHKIVELDDEILDEQWYDFYSPSNFDDNFGQKQLKLHEAIKSLNSTVKEVLELRFLQNKTRKEAAEILQISEDQVHTYQKRGVRYLKDRLNGGEATEQSAEFKVLSSKIEKLEENTPTATLPPLSREGKSSS
jgi:RNA polymerase sigma factor (sigma-70 family)